MTKTQRAKYTNARLKKKNMKEDNRYKSVD